MPTSAISSTSTLTAQAAADARRVLLDRSIRMASDTAPPSKEALKQLGDRVIERARQGFRADRRS